MCASLLMLEEVLYKTNIKPTLTKNPNFNLHYKLLQRILLIIPIFLQIQLRLTNHTKLLLLIRKMHKPLLLPLHRIDPPKPKIPSPNLHQILLQHPLSAPIHLQHLLLLNLQNISQIIIKSVLHGPIEYK
jgi:hypothetical protein